MEKNKEETIAFKYEPTMSEETSEPTDKQEKKKFNYKFKPRHLILIIAAIIMLITTTFLAVNFFAKSGEPVYGARCDGRVEVDMKIVNDAMNQFNTESDPLETASVSLNCLTFEFKLGFKPETSVVDAQNTARDLLTRIDQTLGHPIETGRKYSNLFFKIDGVKQYDVTMLLTGGEGFPVFGSKEALEDDFAWSVNRPRDEEYARQLREEAERKKAEAEAQRIAEEEAKKNGGKTEETPVEQPKEENKEGGGE